MGALDTLAEKFSCERWAVWGVESSIPIDTGGIAGEETPADLQIDIPLFTI